MIPKLTYQSCVRCIGTMDHGPLDHGPWPMDHGPFWARPRRKRGGRESSWLARTCPTPMKATPTRGFPTPAETLGSEIQVWGGGWGDPAPSGDCPTPAETRGSGVLWPGQNLPDPQIKYQHDSRHDSSYCSPTFP